MALYIQRSLGPRALQKGKGKKGEMIDAKHRLLDVFYCNRPPLTINCNCLSFWGDSDYLLRRSWRCGASESLVTQKFDLLAACFGPIFLVLVLLFVFRMLLGIFLKEIGWKRGEEWFFFKSFWRMNEKALTFHFSNPNLSMGRFRCFGSIGVVDKPCNCFRGVSWKFLYRRYSSQTKICWLFQAVWEWLVEVVGPSILSHLRLYGSIRTCWNLS